MPWNKRNYPVSMKNLEPRVREKAVEIANALLEEGNEEGKATILVTKSGFEILTDTADWPMLDVQIEDRIIRRPDILVL